MTAVSKKKLDYALYLVTDSTPAILGTRDLCDVVDRALCGGVSIVQYRDKTSDTGVLVSTAKKLHKVTQKHGVPLLINDRVDVALAVGCEGVHLGQDDMEIGIARKLLGDDKIIGISANTVDEALKACEQGADYLGIGTIFSTQTKKNIKSVIGPSGLRDILQRLKQEGYQNIPTVAIGGIKASNIEQIIYQGSTPKKPLDGVAVVSAIVAAEDPQTAAEELRDMVLKSLSIPGKDAMLDVRQDLILETPVILRLIHATKPLSHNMTNLVVQNFAANVALCVGASPIMANYGAEAADLAELGGALVVNMGTVTPEGIQNYQQAIKAYNEARRPVVFDPVGAGATAVRRAAVKSILSCGFFDVLKGNESEIKTVYNTLYGDGSDSEHQRGVDSSSTLSLEEKMKLVKSLAQNENINTVVMTGKTDVVSDGHLIVTIDNGHEYLGMVTGTGCTLGTTISAAVGAYCLRGGQRNGERFNVLKPVVAAILLFEVAAEQAAVLPHVRGPGSFVPAFLDSLYQLQMMAAKDEGDIWFNKPRITVATLEE